MYVLIAIVSSAAYGVSGYFAYEALLTPVMSNRAMLGITGMIASGIVLGSALGHLLP